MHRNTGRFSLCVLFLGLLASEPGALMAQSKPDRSKVKPDFTEGIIAEGSTIFTYVDKKRRRRLTLDLYRPSGKAESYPAIVMYFGGGWQNGRPGLFAPLAQALAQRGYVCIVPEYRLSGEAPFPAAVHDAKAAIRWARKFAKRFHIDPTRIATLGGSAGGHLAGFTAATNGLPQFEGGGDHQDASSEIQASVVMCGPMDLTTPELTATLNAASKDPAGHAILDFLGGVAPASDPERYANASPVTHVGAHTPPMLFIDGENDRPRERYLGFWKKLDEAGVHHQFVMMPDAPHPFWNMREWFEPTVDAVDRFLLQQMPKPVTIPDDPSKVHLFVLAGQSNMAGRGEMDHAARLAHPRVVSWHHSARWVAAIHPLHHDKPRVVGVGLGRSFARQYAAEHPGITVGLIPCAVGGSPIDAWRPGGFHPSTKTHPYDDCLRRVRAALPFGTLKGVLWHQGESDAKADLAAAYESKLHDLIERFRMEWDAPELPFLAGQLGQFPERPWDEWRIQIDQAHRRLPATIPSTAFVRSDELKHKGDKTHFDSAAYRKFGQRYFQAFQMLQAER